ncbi:hypothetical protein G9A89_000384 [Geosiphon pyriformis]|nr:hypothetical protein G9A89_000384 [Geosiphon pyriformis]
MTVHLSPRPPFCDPSSGMASSLYIVSDRANQSLTNQFIPPLWPRGPSDGREFASGYRALKNPVVGLDATPHGVQTRIYGKLTRHNMVWRFIMSSLPTESMWLTLQVLAPLPPAAACPLRILSLPHIQEAPAYSGSAAREEAAWPLKLWKLLIWSLRNRPLCTLSCRDHYLRVAYFSFSIQEGPAYSDARLPNTLGQAPYLT